MDLPPPELPPADPNPSPQSNQMVLMVILGGLIFIILIAASIYFFSLRNSRADLLEIQGPITSQQPEAVDIPTTSPTWTTTPSITPTLRATFTPESTRTTTVSPSTTITPTPSLVPSLTPAVPLEENDRYELIDWIPELADRLIKEMEAYPDTLSAYARREDNSGYFDAYSYAVFALKESLQRFPSAPQSKEWQWRLAVNLARVGDSSAGALFSTIITQELNKGGVHLENLYDWGLSKTPPATIEIIPLDTPTGFLSSSLVKISLGENGSSTFWLVEKPSGFEAFPLSSDFDFIHPSQVDFFMGDIIGEGSAVIGIFRRSMSDSNEYQQPSLFSLAQQPPVQLDFAPSKVPSIGPEFDSIWEPLPAGSTEGDLQFQTSVFPACPVTVTHNYTWNGEAFVYHSADYQIHPVPEFLGFCEQVINHAANAWGLQPTVDLMESLLPDWPPQTTADGEPYPEDALDEWRYRLAVYNALLGNLEQANGYANAIVTNPATPESGWITPAQEFLNTYTAQREIYRTCLTSDYCDIQKAFVSLLATIPVEQYQNTAEILRQAGVTSLSSGYFDFDNNGQTETWFTIRHQTGSQLEFWILFKEQNRIVPAFVDYLDIFPPRISIGEPLQEPPLITIDPDISFQVSRQGIAGEPFIHFTEKPVVFSTDLMATELDRAEAELLSGGDAETVRTSLIDLKNGPVFTCSYQLCPRYYYLLGLASELVLEKELAIESYLELWRNFLGNPFVTMARYKLSGPAIPPGPTITPTRTNTPRPTATRPFSGTATPTWTATITGTPPTASPTITGTLFTPTLTPTQTETEPYPAAP